MKSMASHAAKQTSQKQLAGNSGFSPSTSWLLLYFLHFLRLGRCRFFLVLPITLSQLGFDVIQERPSAHHMRITRMNKGLVQ